ncbi:Cof-type HAD-IIB family hydrolase [Pediococcus siamensis]|uniref:Cof-type HAD-IIB family hydrolase n=1 Tax=Pediococcus siamensis TaxID=381829 RepID=UPI0039A372B4
MEPYIVFMDIDGTLISHNQNVSVMTKRVISQLQDRGFIFYIATGRMLSLAEVIRKRINDKVEIIASNGSVYQKGHHLHKDHLGWKAISTVYDVTTELGLSTNFFSTDRTFYTRRKPWDLSRLARMRVMQDGAGKFEDVHDRDHLSDVSDQIINGIVIAQGKQDKLAIARERLIEANVMNVSSSSPDNIELIPKRVDKASAVRAIMNQYGIPVERTIAFGNDRNDLGMLKAAGTGVAMGNSADEIKEQADVVTEASEEDGLPRYLKRRFLD